MEKARGHDNINAIHPYFKHLPDVERFWVGWETSNALSSLKTDCQTFLVHVNDLRGKTNRSNLGQLVLSEPIIMLQLRIRFNLIGSGRWLLPSVVNGRLVESVDKACTGGYGNVYGSVALR